MDRIVGKREHHEAVSEAAAEGGAGAPDSNVGLPGHSASDVMAVVGAIVALARGNTDEQVELVSGEASTREVGLSLRLEIGWKWDSESLKGAPAIQGSLGFANHSQVEAYLEEVRY